MRRLLLMILKAQLDNRRRLVRIETRLCRLAERVGVNVKQKL
jgi:hypothetical protein